MTRPRVAIIGGGISGLAAALELLPHADVVVFEASERVGGPVQTVDFAGARVEAGPDSFLARRPEMTELATNLGFGDQLISPTAGDAGIWTRAEVRRMPAGLVLGVPRSTDGLEGLLSTEGVARAADEPNVAPIEVGADIGMGDLIRRRYGEEVFERLVDPLMGGVHAGRSELLSTAVAAPQLLTAAQKGGSLMAALPAAPASSEPVFLTVAAGLGAIVDAAAARIPTIRYGTPVEELRVVGSTWGIVDEEFDAAVVATHAPTTARLVAPFAPDAARVLSRVEYASVVLTLLAYPADAFASPPATSGYLVPRVEEKLTTAVSYWNAKWAQRAPSDAQVLRVSTGRIDDVRHRDIADDELVERLHAELVDATGLRSDAPVAARVNRYEHALPQFRVGHLTDVAAVAHASAEGAPAPLALAGSCYEGLGLPACVASGRAAAGRILDRLSP